MAAMASPPSAERERGRRVRRRLTVRGTVQGVGFRPFVYRAASELGLGGWVANGTDGVVLEIEGAESAVAALVERIRAESPKAAVVAAIDVAAAPVSGERAFEIRASLLDGRIAPAISPDVATCAECIAETLDPDDRRFRYPFTSCTQCGPRFSVIERLPYDRAATSMARFPLCGVCRSEYEDPASRRFHAEATGCPACGPKLELRDRRGRALAERDAALREAGDALRRGLVVAIKGLGGFHLCVDARNDAAVARLRARKRRPTKPLAVLFPSLAAVELACALDAGEAALLSAPAAPIVLLRRRGPNDARRDVAEAVAPRNPYLGAMLPYTPLHHLLMNDLRFPIVATSANVSGEPILVDENAACERLAGIADAFLVHDRPIVRPVDDSVARMVAGRSSIVRRSRGFAPAPAARGARGAAVLALGGHLKSTVAVTIGDDIVLSQHLGRLDSPEARSVYRQAVEDLSRLHAWEPRVVACDLHPDYFTTRCAEQSGLEIVRVQHHVAHVAACASEHGLEGDLLGVAWDGSGFGTDGSIWGGEFISVRGRGYRRVAHLRPFPLPGSSLAVREPRRAALGLLYARYGAAALERDELAPVAAFTPAQRAVLTRMLERGVNAPSTSSAGRLFDAASALVGLCQRASYEGEAAALLEWSLADPPGPECYEFAVTDARLGSGPNVGGPRWIVDWGPAVDALIADLQRGASPASISAAFHNGLVRALVEVAVKLGDTKVLLTGGCFQNAYLTAAAVRALRAQGLQPYWHERVPPNDGGLALGQAAYASRIVAGAKPCA